MTIKLKNNARSTLGATLAVSGLQLTLATGGGSEFPSLGVGEHFYATLVASDGTIEIVEVVGTTGDIFTIIRGAEGTTPAVFPSGSLVELRITVASITDAIANNAGSVVSVAASGGTTGLSFTGSPITSTGTLTLGGTLAVSNGGTGAATLSVARANLLPSYAGNSGKVLAVNGGADDIEWLTVAGTGTVTSVGFSGGTTGLTVSGTNPVTTTGTITLGGALVLANGGTGATTAGAARTNLGLGTIATQDASSVAITGGSVAGITDLAVADGGTGASDAATARTNLGAAASGANTDITALDQDVTVTATGTIGADTLGHRGLPQNSQTSGYTLVLADAGKHISITTGGVTIPANGVTAFPVGTTIVVYNDSASGQTIGISTDTLRLSGTASTGNRTLAQRGLCTLVKVAATEWVVTGNVT
jgi:hypothetical protein